MDSLAFTMAQKELNDPNSQYYLGNPSINEQIDNYMRGVPYSQVPKFGIKGSRTLYAGQPQQDEFAMLANARKSRKIEDGFKAFLGVSAAVLGALILRKVPVVSKIPKLALALLKGAWNVIAALGKGIYNLLK